MTSKKKKYPEDECVEEDDYGTKVYIAQGSIEELSLGNPVQIGHVMLIPI